jgi:hypothetical protein
MDINISKEWGPVTLANGKINREHSKYYSTINSNDVESILTILKPDDYTLTMIAKVTLSEDNNYDSIKKISTITWNYHIELITKDCSRWITLSKEDFEITLRDIKINKILSTKECD